MTYRELLNRVNETRVVDICRALVRYKTINPPGDELPAAEYIASLLREAGFEARLVTLSDARASVIARLRGSGQAPALFFNGHLDVVPPGADPWLHDPFEANVADGKIWGRGSADMKGGLAAILAMAELVANARLPLRGDLIVTASADEETGMAGAKQIAAQADLGPLQAAIIAEPTNNEIGLAERGVLWLQLDTYGKTAHGSTPHLGQNAIMMMVALLAELEHLSIPYAPHPILGSFTHSINTIDGGVKTNVVPDHCTATVDMRTVPGQDQLAIVQQVKQLIADLEQRQPGFRGSVKAAYKLPAVETGQDEPAVQSFAKALAQATGREPSITQVRFATEAGVYVPALHVPTIICGPGDPALAHQPNEFVEIRQLVEATKIFTLATASMLA
jgi:succinyl-diaminopimelate desuccinylase